MTSAVCFRALARAVSIAAVTLGAAGALHAEQGVGTAVVEQPKVVPFEFNGDLSKLPQISDIDVPARPLFRRPVLRPPLPPEASAPQPIVEPSQPIPGPRTPAPPAIQDFAGMGFTDSCGGPSCGGGWPPDPNHDVGPNHIVQSVNVGYAIYNKTGTRLAAFSENSMWTTTGSNNCNGNSAGDPVVIYDRLADRWILTHFAFGNSGPPFFDPVGPFLQCIAVSKTGDPVSGGYWLYPVRMDPGTAGTPPVGALNDYGKFGAWSDCFYMGANEFNFATPGASHNYLGSLFASFSRADMYSGAPLTFGLGYIPGGPFTMIPAHNLAMPPNAPPRGTPEYFVSDFFTNLEVRKFTAGSNCGGGGVLGAPTSISTGAYTFLQGNLVPQPNTTNKLDMIDDRPMQKVIYRNIGGVESLWTAHTVGLSASGPTAMQWLQINVTGGTVNATPIQQGIHDSTDPTLWRFMGSVAVDGQGNMLLGYSTSGSASPNFPSIAVAGRLAGDPLNTLAQTERQVTAGGGSQTNSCGGPCDRWGDYSAMSVDPSDDCTFWYTTEYYANQTQGTAGNWQTRILSFKFPGCTTPITGSSRTFVSATSAGDDAHPCSAISPCRTLAHAITVTTPGGEIQILDSGGYGGLTIDRPITIAASEGVYAGVSVSSGTGISVSAGLSGPVTLRGLTLNGLASASMGISLGSASALYVDRCTISGFSTGIGATPSVAGLLDVQQSQVRDNSATGIIIGSSSGGMMQLVINDTLFERNALGLNVVNHGAIGTIRNTTFAGGTVGLSVGPNTANAGTLELRKVTVRDNSLDGLVVGSGATTVVNVADSLFAANGVGILTGPGGTTHIASTTITRNTTGVSNAGGGTSVSFGNNRLLNNTSNGSFSSSVLLQ